MDENYMGFNAELQPYVPADYISVVLREDYEHFVRLHFWSYGELPRISMYYCYMDHDYLQNMVKRAKIYRLLRTYMEVDNATNVLSFLSPLVKDADEDYLEEIVRTLRYRLRQGDIERRQVREFLNFLWTIERRMLTPKFSTRTTTRAEIPILRQELLGLRNMQPPFPLRKQSERVVVNKDYGDFLDPRSVYYHDQWDPTTRDYGNYYRQEYNDMKNYVQALRAEDAAAAAALRAPQQAAQQGVLARLRRPRPPPFDDAEDYLGALFAIGGLAGGGETARQRQQQDAYRRLRDRLADAHQEN